MHLLLYSDNPEPSSSSRGMWRWIVIALLIGAAGLVIARSVFFVDESQYVYVTQFGEPVRFHSRPGLQIKWPYQGVRRFDRRLQLFEPSPREMLTQDKENLSFAWYLCWRLPGGTFVRESNRSIEDSAIDGEIERYVRRFLQAVGTIESAENRLEERVQAALAAEVGRLRFDQLVSLDGQQLQLEELADRLTRDMRAIGAEQFGVEIVDVRLKRFTYPEAVKPAVFAEIRSERERVAVQHRAEGASQKARIQSTADLERQQLLAHAKREALAIRGGGEAKAIEIFNAAHGKDPKFYELLKTLETYRSVLDDQTTVVLSAESPILKLLTHGLPEPSAMPPATTPTSNPPAASKTTALPNAEPAPRASADERPTSSGNVATSEPNP